MYLCKAIDVRNNTARRRLATGGGYISRGTTYVGLNQLRNLLIQPDLIQRLVQVVTGRNFPPFYVRTVRIDLIPPQCQGSASRGERLVLKLAHNRPLLIL
jgi:hypothetical protein